MGFTIIKETLTFLDKKTNIGFVFWFFIGVLITVIFYKPFDQPILFDRAYLLYMSQVVFRGDPLYEATTFGYTPLSTILVGFLMKLGSIISLSTIESARIIGLLVYGSMCGSIFILCDGLFNEKKASSIACILFCGLSYIQVLSGINAEPKLWVLLFSILGIHFFNKRNWFLVGLFFSFAAMSWHVAVISLFACAVMLPWNSKQFFPSLYKLFIGVFIGVLPVLFYLQITNGWLDFWNQAVIRKLLIEGDVLGESPFNWLVEGIYPFFILESLHFLFGFLGCVISLYLVIKPKNQMFDTLINKQTLIFLIIYCFLWGIFNSIDFQSEIDLLTLIPPVIIFCTYFLIIVFKKIKQKTLSAIVILIFFGYNFFDAFIYELPYTFSEQLKTIDRLKVKYNKMFVISFEEYYVLQEKPMPTKFMRYEPYEDHMIENSENGCAGIGELIHKEKFNSVIELDYSKHLRSMQLQRFLDKLKQSNVYEKKRNRSNCATYMIENYTSSKEIDSFTVKHQSIPLGKNFYTYKYYSVFKFK